MKIFILVYYFCYNEISIIANKFFRKNLYKTLKNDLFFKKIKNSNNSLQGKIKSKKLILVESLIEHPAYFIKNIIIANQLRKILGNELILLVNEGDAYAYQLAKSFKIKNIIFFKQPHLLIRLKNFFLSVNIFFKLKNIEDLLELKYNGVFIGKSIYDLTLRLKSVGSYNKIDGIIFYHLLKFINAVFFIEEILKKNQINLLLQDEKQFYPSSLLFQLALKNKIKCYIKAGERKYITLRKYEKLHECYEHKLKFSKKLIRKIFHSKHKKKIILSGKNSMRARFYAKPIKTDSKDAKHFNIGNIISKKNLIKKFKWNYKKPIGIIFANNLTDGVFVRSWNLFRDNESWLKFILNEIKKNDEINWIVKEHPSDVKNNVKYGTKYLFKSIIRNKKNIKLLPKNINAKSLHKVVDFVFSSHGSAGLEYPFLGIPCITSAESLYSGLGFTYECNSLTKLKNAIKNPLRIKPIDNRTRDLLCIYLDVYINRAKFEVRMTDFKPDNTINLNEFNKNLYNYWKKNNIYNGDFEKALEIQCKNSYKHTVNLFDIT